MFQAELAEPIYPDRSRPEEVEIARIMRAYSAALEREVRAHPDHWFWMHRRWKSRPPDATVRDVRPGRPTPDGAAGGPSCGG
jgi:lauroyl/myristoyl acyltransferase